MAVENDEHRGKWNENLYFMCSSVDLCTVFEERPCR